MCRARQCSDQMRCDRCTLVWDVNDPEPPKCKDTEVIVTDRAQRFREFLRQLKESIR